MRAPSSSEVNAIISGIGTGYSTYSYYSRAFPRSIFKDSNVLEIVTNENAKWYYILHKVDHRNIF